MAVLMPLLTELGKPVFYSLKSGVAGLKSLLEEYFHETGSKKAALMLSDWEQYRPKFVRIFPVEYRNALARAGR